MQDAGAQPQRFGLSGLGLGPDLSPVFLRSVPCVCCTAWARSSAVGNRGQRGEKGFPQGHTAEGGMTTGCNDLGFSCCCRLGLNQAFLVLFLV